MIKTNTQSGDLLKEKRILNHRLSPLKFGPDSHFTAQHNNTFVITIISVQFIYYIKYNNLFWRTFRITCELHNRRRQEEQYNESTVVIIEGRQWDHRHQYKPTNTSKKNREKTTVDKEESFCDRTARLHSILEGERERERARFVSVVHRSLLGLECVSWEGSRVRSAHL